MATGTTSDFVFRNRNSKRLLWHVIRVANLPAFEIKPGKHTPRLLSERRFHRRPSLVAGHRIQDGAHVGAERRDRLVLAVVNGEAHCEEVARSSRLLLDVRCRRRGATCQV